MAKQADRLISIKISGFKSAMEPVEVRIANLTILAGQNSAGKSTVMQPLLMIKQTIEKPYDPGGLAIDGPLVRFTSADQFLSRRSGRQRTGGYDLTLQYDRRTFSLHYGRSETTGIDLLKMSVTEPDRSFTWRLGQTLKRSDPSLRTQGRSSLDDNLDERDRLEVVRDGATLAARLVGGLSDTLHYSVVWANAVNEDARGLIHLPGLRGNPERSYPISIFGPRYPGSFNDYVASVVNHWQSVKDTRLENLGRNLHGLGLTSHVAANRIDDTRVEVLVGRLPTAYQGGQRDTVNIADVGFGVSQTLPVLVALLAAEKGQLVFIEQPELHLHPKAQVALASLLVDAANRGVRVIAETHSHLLLLALQKLIAKGDIDPENISMNWFTRDTEGQTHVAEAKLESDGSYGDWPVDFDSIELRLQDEYLTLVEAQHG